MTSNDESGPSYRCLQILGALRVGGVPDPVAILLEHELRFGRRNHPVATLELALELARPPAGIAERHQRVLGTFAAGDVEQDLAAGGDRQSRVDLHGAGPMIV